MNKSRTKETLIDRAALMGGGPVPSARLRKRDSLPGPSRSPKRAENWLPIRPNRIERAGPGGGIARLEDLTKGFQDAPPCFLEGCVLVESEDSARLVPIDMDLAIPDELRARHTLVVGPTGSGKTAKVILPSIWRDLNDPELSLIVMDAKGDLTAPVLEMARMARGSSCSVRYISFSEPDRSLSWNPIAGLASRSECREIAKCFSIASGSLTGTRDGQFFRVQAEKLVTGLIFGLQDHPDLCSPGCVQALLDLTPTALEAEARRLGVESALNQITMAESNHNAQTVLLEAMNHLQAFADPDIVLTTSSSEFEFDELVSQPTVLILRFPEGVERLRAIHNAFVKRLFSWVASEADRHPGKQLPRPVSCYLDEFASIGRLPDIERALSTFRSRRFSITAAVQSTGQLQPVYGDVAEVLAEAFGSWILIPPVGLRDSRLASVKTGLMAVEYVDTDGSRDGQIVRSSTQLRSVLSEDEIAIPAVHPELGSAITLLLPETPPFQAFLPPVFKYPVFAHWDRTAGHAGPLEEVPSRRTALVAPKYEVGAAKSHDCAFTSTRCMSEFQVRECVERVKRDHLDWDNTTGSARRWWEEFEAANGGRLGLVLRLAEELRNRKATITEFFLSYVYSSVDNIQANLHYFDYLRLKKEEERKRDEAARRQKQDSDG